MERHNSGKERLIVPTDFNKPALPRNVQKDLVPPSHFETCVQSAGAHRGVQTPGPQPPISWVKPGGASAPSPVPPSGDPGPANPWLAITQAQQEILELKKENRRIMKSQGDSMRGQIPVDHPSGPMARCPERSDQWSRWESGWRLEAEKYKAEAERMKGQVEALKETAGSHMDSTLNRQSHELESTRQELRKAQSELGQLREELNRSREQEEKMSSQLERLKGETAAEMTKLRRDAERHKEESRQLTVKAELCRLQAEEDNKRHSLTLSQQLQEMHDRQEVKLQQLNASHCAELGAAEKTNQELRDELRSMTSGVVQLKSTLMEASTERDGLKEHLSQMGQAFETQSATLSSLRKYIGQLAPEKGEKERLNDAVERLNKEKAALQMTTELLTVRFKSVNEILALQEEKLLKKSSTDPLLKKGSEGLQVLQLWREKVFKLCVQLRLKDIELRREKDQLLSNVRSTEQQLQQEQHRASVLQHSLDDRMAELDLERVEKETLKQDLVQSHKEITELKSRNEKAQDELTTLTAAVHSFRLAFESKAAEVDAAQTKLNTSTQRLVFAKRRVETIQGLVMRRVALQKIQQASQQEQQASDRLTDLQTELSLACEERDRLTQELKRSPELIDKALADLKEQYESRLRKQQQETQHISAQLQEAAAGRKEAECSLRAARDGMEQSRSHLEDLRSQLLGQQEHSEQVLRQTVSEIEECCAEKLSEMEAQVNTARREHTKAVMTLRQFERDAARRQDETRGAQRRSLNKHAKREVQNKHHLKETGRDSDRLLVPVTESRLMSEYAKIQNSERTSERGCFVEAKAQPPAERNSLLSVLDELHTLSTAVVNSSEDEEEEDEEEEDRQGDRVRPDAESHS